jgi:hypothetical protein
MRFSYWSNRSWNGLDLKLESPGLGWNMVTKHQLDSTGLSTGIPGIQEYVAGIAWNSLDYSWLNRRKSILIPVLIPGLTDWNEIPFQAKTTGLTGFQALFQDN